MFRRIVSNLSFSPALVGQLGFYARRLRKEEATRRLGLVFTALALIVQSLAVFSPPEAANAATPGQVGSAPRCTVTAVGTRDTAFNISQANKANVTFDVSGGANCKVQLSVNTFYAPSMDGTPYEQQVLFQRNTKQFDAPGRYTMGADLPDSSNQAKGCFYQADLTYGTYNVLPVLAYAHGKLNCGTTTTPTVTCTSLNIIQATPGRQTLIGKGQVTGGYITKYLFQITKPNGVVAERAVVTNANTASVDFDHDNPGTYSVKLIVYSNFGEDSGANCKGSFFVPSNTPVAACGTVNAIVSDRTKVSLTGAGVASGGATIQSYVFSVKNSAGVEVKSLTVPSTGINATAPTFDLAQAGSYTVDLTVNTSLGPKTNADSCHKAFSIAPPEVCQYNPNLPPSSPDCQPCPDNPGVWIKDGKCKAVLVNSKTASNMTQGNVDASTVTAKSNDKITYTITVQNNGLLTQPVTMQENLSDVLEYSTLVDQGGAQFNNQDKTLTWPAVSLAAGQKQSRTFAIQLMNDIPATNTGTGIPSSYDCKMGNTFGNTINVKVDCPGQKVIVEQVTSELPHTGPRENMIFAGMLLAVVVYFYARSRQLGTEVRLIRRNLNTGTL